jgi:hypothetical protein
VRSQNRDPGKTITTVVFGTVVVFLLGFVILGFAINLKLSGDLSYGDLLVGVGTLALAVVTGVLAGATYGIDKRAAARERERQRREHALRADELKGVAMLVYAEAGRIQSNLRNAVNEQEWEQSQTLLHPTWDRDGAKIVPLLSESQASSVVGFFTNIAALEAVIAPWAYDEHRKHALSENDVSVFYRRQENADLAIEFLEPLAYPKGSDPV